MISRLMLMIAMVLALASAAPAPAHADWDDRPDPAEFEESLAPHGYWVDDSQFGRVWRPYTWWTWRPYVDGRWIWTSYGWTWASDEPWDWTFHYGRWGFSNLYGWVWTPGYVWGPAWVDWYWGDGYVGWVPLGPPGFAIVPTYWTYVHDFSFCSPRITNVFIAHDHLPNFIVHHREHGWGVRHAPGFRDIEHVSRHRIEQSADRPDRSIAPWVKHRIERGDRVREHVADRGGERVIEHRGRNDRDERGGGPRASDDGWRRPSDRRDRSPQVIDRDGNPPMRHGRIENDDRMAPRPNDGVQPRQRVDDDRPPMPHGRGDASRPPRSDSDDGFRRRSDSDDGRGWVRPAPRRSEPFPAPQPGQVDRSGPSMGHRGAGGGPVFVERGQPTPSRGAPAPRGDVGSRGAPGAGGGGGTMQHGHAGGTPSGGHSSPGGGDSGSFGGAR
jgi:hypothetical protein